MIKVDVDARETQAALDRMAGGSRAVAAIRLLATNARPYVWGIETGFRRNGRLARRAGGAYMYARGLAASQDRLGAMLAEGVPYGPQGVNNAYRRWGRTDAEPAIRRLTPIRSGRLRADVRVRPG